MLVNTALMHCKKYKLSGIKIFLGPQQCTDTNFMRKTFSEFGMNFIFLKKVSKQ